MEDVSCSVTMLHCGLIVLCARYAGIAALLNRVSSRGQDLPGCTLSKIRLDTPRVSGVGGSLIWHSRR